jgi:hypothetical protein
MDFHKIRYGYYVRGDYCKAIFLDLYSWVVPMKQLAEWICDME